MPSLKSRSQKNSLKRSSKSIVTKQTINFFLVMILIISIIGGIIILNDLNNQKIAKTKSALHQSQETFEVLENTTEGYTFLYPSGWEPQLINNRVEISKLGVMGKVQVSLIEGIAQVDVVSDSATSQDLTELNQTANKIKQTFAFTTKQTINLKENSKRYWETMNN